jgi:hypothetical protein
MVICTPIIVNLYYLDPIKSSLRFVSKRILKYIYTDNTQVIMCRMNPSYMHKAQFVDSI